MFDLIDTGEAARRTTSEAGSPAAIDAVEVPLAAAVGVVNAATGRVVELIAEALGSGIWAQAGVRSPEHWVSWKTGVSLRRARRLVVLAHRRAELPATSAALSVGALSEDQAVEIGLHVPADAEAEVAGFAAHATVGQVRTVARTHSRRLRPEPPPPPGDDPAGGPSTGDPSAEPAGDDRNTVTFGFGDDGRWWCRADLDPDLGALVQTALEACRDVERHDRHPDRADGTDETDGTDPTAATRVTWADTLVRLADAALHGLTGDRPAADRHQVVIHTRAGGSDAHLHLGPALPTWSRRLHSCDATLRWLLEDADGVPLKLGRRQRGFTWQQRLVVESRYQGRCAAPGCQSRRGLQLHHHQHWEDGGATDVDNALPLCGGHHRLHHRGDLTIVGDPGRPATLVFRDRHGRLLTAGAAPTLPASRDVGAAAAGAGIAAGRWVHASGERLQHWAISPLDPPTAA